MTRTLIAALPWNLADMMSVQVAGLKAFLASRGEDVVGRHYYLDIHRHFTEDEVEIVHSALLGEHLFAMLLFPEHAAAIGERLRSRSKGVLDPVSCRARLQAYLEEVTESIVALNPDLIGFTTTHMQYLPSLTVAKAVRARLPNVRIVLGGLSLYGEPAKATLRVFPWIDYIIVGEGETALWRLSQQVRGERRVEEVPQLLYRVGAEVRETSVVESVPDLDDLPLPDYSDYFAALSASGRAITPRATIEMVRGCRWGRCSFCVEGLPSRGGFRSKSPARVALEVERCVSEHKILDFVTSDPDVAFNGPLFEAVKHLNLDARFMVELSGLVRVEQLEVMVRAGVRTLQIGIESFSPRMLAALNKGVSLTKYVQLLRFCAENGLKLVYNNIYGCPFTTQQDLDEAVENMRRLLYFQPPRLSEFRVSIGSQIYANYRDYGIQRLLPSDEVEGYPPEIADQVGMLMSFNAGWGFEASAEAPKLDYGPYLELLQDWRQIWALSPRREARRGRGFLRVDHEVGDQRYSVHLSDPVQMELLRVCQQLRRKAELRRRFPDVSEQALDDALEELWRLRLLFRSGGEHIALVSVPASADGL